MCFHAKLLFAPIADSNFGFKSKFKKILFNTFGFQQFDITNYEKIIWLF